MKTMPMMWASDYQGDVSKCAHCNRPLNSADYWIEVIDGGDLVAKPGSMPDESDYGYMGCFPVGKTCAEKYFKGFTFYTGK